VVWSMNSVSCDGAARRWRCRPVDVFGLGNVERASNKCSTVMYS
jgi:hypothetical protein